MTLARPYPIPTPLIKKFKINKLIFLSTYKVIKSYKPNPVAIILKASPKFKLSDSMADTCCSFFSLGVDLCVELDLCAFLLDVCVCFIKLELLSS